MATADPVDLITTIGLALVLVCVGTFAWAARDDIVSFVKRMFARYIHIQRHTDPERSYILSSQAIDDAVELDRLDALRAGSYQHEPDSAEPPAEPVRPERLGDDDIIDWLAHLKSPGKTAYRFSANQIAELIGGTRAEILKKVAAHRPAAPPPRTIVAREHRDGQLVERELFIE
jgi:hypothetical protein